VFALDGGVCSGFEANKNAGWPLESPVDEAIEGQSIRRTQ
jgi:hypothetical protein